MKKVLVVTLFLALPFMVALSVVSAGKDHAWRRPAPQAYPFPVHPCRGRRLAAACMLEGVRAGAFESMDSAALADFCLDAAKRVCRPDVEPDPAPEF